MKTVIIIKARNSLSALIDGLKRGSPVLVMNWRRPVAKLEAVTGEREGNQAGMLARLVRDGLVRPRRTMPSSYVFSIHPPHAVAGASVVEAVLEERREER